jgi:predicted aldo/keto reductase-like oxidoreductase
MSSEANGKPSSSSRRNFMKATGALTAGLVAEGVAGKAAIAEPLPPFNPATPQAMPTRNLGRTGFRVGIFSLGGQAAVEQPRKEAEAVAIVEKAIDLGINYIDTAPVYGGTGGWSQRYIGQVMKRRRNEVYLASKTHDRTRGGSLKLLEESLYFLNTDHLDAWQLHNVATKDDVDRIFAKGGAIEALKWAREQKMVRFLGVTGHSDPEVLMECLRRFPFDQILMAVNAADPHHLSFEQKLLPMAVEKQMGIIGMKIPARGRLLSNWPAVGPYGPEKSKPGPLGFRDAFYYVLSLPVSTVVIGCDSVEQLAENVRLAREFTPLSEPQRAALTAKAEPVAREALFFRRWS